MSAPRPRGTDRTDDLLSLNAAAVQRRRVLMMLADQLHDACMVYQPAPRVEAKYARITHPRPGDLVVEVSAVHSSIPERQLRGFGVLLATRIETIPCEDDEPYDEQAWYVQYGPAADDVCRWTNCAFIAIPQEWWQ